MFPNHLVNVNHTPSKIHIFPTKEAEINALQRFQLLFYGNYYIQFYCKTINSESLFITKHLKYDSHLVPFGTTMIRL